MRLKNWLEKFGFPHFVELINQSVELLEQKLKR